MTIRAHYSQVNSYIKSIIEKSNDIDANEFFTNKITKQTTINLEKNKIYYFYLKYGTGKINNFLFSEKDSSFIIYSGDNLNSINIRPISDYIEYYYQNKTINTMNTINIIQEKVNFGYGNKFIFEKDFPINFYSRVDGTKDITFNIEFFKLESEESYNETTNLFDIIAYLVTDEEIKTFESNINYYPNSEIYNGTYNNSLSLGKLVIEKETINKHLNFSYMNYLYVIIRKNDLNSNTYNHLEGQIIFFSMDYFYSIVPEGFLIYSNLFEVKELPICMDFLETILQLNFGIQKMY